MSNLNFALVNGQFSPILFAPSTPNQIEYLVCDKLADNISIDQLSKICFAYPHLTPCVTNSKQFASNVCRLAAIKGVNASTYLKLSKI